MSIVLVEFDAETQESELALDSRGFISLEGGLETPVLFSIGSNRRARPSDGMEDQPYGWWGDDFEPGDEYGSHMWIVQAKGKLTAQDLRKATVATRQALQWMVDDGLASSIEVSSERVDPVVIKQPIKINRPKGKAYFKIWEIRSGAI